MPLYSSIQADLSEGTVPVDFNGQTLIDIGAPVNNTDAATKGYVDGLANGIDWKNAVRAATTANITLSGTQTVDGVALIVGDRVLVKDQTAPEENGIYIVASGAWTRATDMDAWAEVPSAAIFIESGTINMDRGFVCTADQGGTLETTAIPFTQFTSVASYTADGQGLELTGFQFALELDGTTLSKAAAGLKVAANGITNAEVNPSAAITLSKLATLTSNRTVISNGSGVLAVSTVTDTELSYVSGVTSSIQTQLNATALSSRNLTAGAGMIGGGNLTADRTFDIAANADGSIVVNANDIQIGVLATDAQHGTRGGGTQHAVATTSVAGFMSGADKLKLDGVPAGATTQIQYNEAGALAASSALTFTSGANPFVSITGTTATNQLRVGGATSINNAAMYIESNNANQDGLRCYFNSGTPATSGIIAYAYSGSQPYIRIVDADDDPTYVQFDVIGGGTEAAPAITARFGARGPNAGATTGFSWYVNGTEVSQLDTNYWLEPVGTTAARPGTPVNGMQRYNTTLAKFEGYENGAWTNFIPVFGTQYHYAESEAVSTTTSTTYQNKVTLTTASVPAGTYRIAWSYQWNHDSTADSFQGRVQQDATTISEHVQELQDSGGTFGSTGTSQQMTASGFKNVTYGAAGTHTIAIDYNTNVGGVNSSIWNARIEFWRVS